MNSQTPSDRPPGFWSSLFTDEASFRGGQFNFWATAETILAICGFWVVALHWETLWLLYTSLFIAPLLFLRSDASVKQGVDWFEHGFFPPRWPDDPDERAAAKERLSRRWQIGIAIVFCVAISVGYLAEKYFLAGHEGWAAFLRGLPFGLGVVFFTTALAVGVGRGLGVVMVAGEVMVVALLVALLVAGVVAVGGELAGGIAGYAMLMALIVAVFWLPGFTLGVWLHSLVARICATLRHLDDGYRAMPANIRRLAFFIAPLHPPELLPGLPEAHELSFGGYVAIWTAQLNSPIVSDKFSGAWWFLMLPLWFAPGWAYRIILKSTLWLWWILFFIGGTPNVAGGVEGLEADYKKIWVRFSLVFAAIGFGVFLLGNFFDPFVSNQFSKAPLIPILAVLFLIDWRSIPFLPLLDALSSVLTMGAWLWADSIVKDSEVSGREGKVSQGLRRLAHLIQWKTAIGVLTIALLMLYVAFLANAKLGLWPVSDWLFNGLSWLYGKYAAALR